MTVAISPAASKEERVEIEPRMFHQNGETAADEHEQKKEVEEWLQRIQNGKPCGPLATLSCDTAAGGI